MAERICGTCGSPIVVRDGKALSVIDGSFIAERDALKAAVTEASEALALIFVMLTGADPMWAEMPWDERCARAANEAQAAHERLGRGPMSAAALCQPTASPLHPHEPEIPPTLDDEGRCLVCLLLVEVERLREALTNIGGTCTDDESAAYALRMLEPQKRP